MYLEQRFKQLFPEGTPSDFKVFLAGATVSLHHVREARITEDTALLRCQQLKAEIASYVAPQKIN